MPTTHIKFAAFYLYLHRMRRRVERDPRPYSDAALVPIDAEQPGAFVRGPRVAPAAV